MIDSSFLWITACISLALVSVGADSLIKLAGKSAGGYHFLYFLLGLIIYGSTAFGWYFVLKHIKLSTLGVYYSVSTVLFLALVSVFFFKESISSLEILCIIFAIASIFLLGRFA